LQNHIYVRKNTNKEKSLFFAKKNILFFIFSMEEVFKTSNANHVFKKCKSLPSGNDCIVMLEKPSNDFSCNESRTVFNKNRAKFRCNGLLVKIIFDLMLNIELSCIVHETIVCYTTHRTHYEVGCIVKPNYFDTNLDKICTFGIHYFLTLKAAIGYDSNKGCCIIDGVEYDSNGYAGFKVGNY
jgi:hypothetical protein